MKTPPNSVFACFSAFAALAQAVFAVGGASPQPSPQPAQKLPTVAVLRLESSKIDTADLEVLRDALTVELQNSGVVRVMERSQMNSILSEQGFQSSGSCDQSECAVEVGKLLAVDRMVLGSAGKIGDTWSVTLRLVRVETGEVAASVRDSRTGSIEVLLSQSVPKLANQLVQAMGSKPASVAGSEASFLEASLIIGDKTFRKQSGFDRLEAISPSLSVSQTMMLNEKGSTSKGWAWANLYPFIPVGSMVQGDWPGVGWIYLGYVPGLIATGNSSNSAGVLIAAAWGFQIARPIYFATVSNTKLKKALHLQASSWTPAPALQLTSRGDLQPALAWTF